MANWGKKKKKSKKDEIEEEEEIEEDLEEETESDEDDEEDIEDEEVKKPSKKSSKLEKKLKMKQLMEERKNVVFDYDAAKNVDDSTIIFSIYGDKNDAKTTIGYGLLEKGESILVISFDNKSKRPLRLPFVKKRNLDVEVLDGRLHYDESSKELKLITSEVTKDFVLYLLNTREKNDRPDYIMIDATGVLNTIYEMAMRSNNNVDCYAGISNPNIWKERAQYIDDLLKVCVRVAKKGVIFTMYTDIKELVRNGEVVTKKEVPKWLSGVMRETDIVIRASTEKKKGEKSRTFYATIESTKLVDEYPEGRYDVTNTTLCEVLEKVV